MLRLPTATWPCAGMFRRAATTHTPRLTWKRLNPKPDVKGVPCERSSHGISWIQNEAGSRLILYGGEKIARTPLNPSEALWVAEKDHGWSWRSVTCAGPPSRVAHAQASIGSFVYIFGGRCGTAMEEEPLNDLWALDCHEPGKESWSKVEPGPDSDDPPEPRSFHQMIAVDQNLYVFGGCGTTGRLADLHRFNTTTGSWRNLGKSQLLRGRGGANLLCFGDQLSVIAGFAGEETNDGHAYNMNRGAWEAELLQLDLRPRSVCVAISLGERGLIFGGEVNPSDLGHEGAGAFENDVVVIDGVGHKAERIPSTCAAGAAWPEQRGWAAGASEGGSDRFYIFGGLAGDDEHPRRLNDLWQCEVE